MLNRMKEMEMLEDRAWEDIKQLLKKENITPSEWENISKVVCVLKEMKVMEGMDSYIDDEGYSQTGMPRMHYQPDLDHSYARGRSMTTGRYISRDAGSSYTGGGYSGHSIQDRMIARLEKMMDEASSEYERQQISEEISRMRMNSRAN